MALITRQLKVDLVDIQGRPVTSIAVGVSLVNQDIAFPVKDSDGDTTPETFYPTTASGVTDSNGEATFNLMPSEAVGAQLGVGDYVVTVGSFSRTITMPNMDVVLSEL